MYQVLQCFARRGNPTCSPHEYLVALDYLHTFSVNGSPAGGYCSILLALSSLQVGREPHM